MLDKQKFLQEIKKVDLLINCTSIGYENLLIKNNKIEYLEYFNPLHRVNTISVKKSQNSKKNFMILNTKKILNNYNNSIKIISTINKNAIIMDVVYQPIETSLIKISKVFNLKTISGKRMNILQAVLGFNFCFKHIKKILKLLKK